MERTKEAIFRPGLRGHPITSTETKGFLYATTGADYTTLARRSARSLRLVMPRAQIDLFTDQEIEDPVFSRIHRLRRVSHRPKMEAMLRSRFKRMILLDADTVVVAKVHDMFDLLDYGLIAATQAVARPWQMYREQSHIPRAFPYFNAGVIALRKAPETTAMLHAWERAMINDGLAKDQPTLRQLVHQMRIPFQVLPLEYNLIHLPALDVWEHYFGAPRILHVRDLQTNPPGDPTLPFDLDETIGVARAARVRAQLAGTAHLGVVIPDNLEEEADRLDEVDIAVDKD